MSLTINGPGGMPGWLQLGYSLRNSLRPGVKASDAPTILAWATEHRPFLVPERRFDLAHHQYLIDIYQDRSQRMVIYKAAQMGISEYLLSYALHGCDKRNGTVLYVLPNDGLIGDFSTARLGPAIEASQHLGTIIKDSHGPKRGADRVTLKRVGDRFLYLRGGQVKPDGKAPQLKSIDADIIIVDELDECDARVKDIVRKRLGHSSIAEERLVSTPSYPGAGIHAEYMGSDMCEWFIRCHACKQWQTVTINSVVHEWEHGKPKAWHQAGGNPFAACEKCLRALVLHQPGEWVATHPGRDVRGYHVKKFFGPNPDLATMIDGLSSSNLTKVRETWNQDLGEVWSPPGGSLTDEHLDACRRDYSMVTRRRTFMGIDVGAVLHVTVREEPDPITGERRLLFAGERNWDEVRQVIRTYDPTAVVIDALPETKSARDLQAEYPAMKVWLCYYGAGESSNKKDEVYTPNYSQGTILADRTRSLDETYARFYEKKNVIPMTAKSITHYYEQLKAPVRTMEKKRDGTQVARYVEGTRADHFAHSENYVTLASMLRTTAGVAGVLDY